MKKTLKKGIKKEIVGKGILIVVLTMAGSIYIPKDILAELSNESISQNTMGEEYIQEHVIPDTNDMDDILSPETNTIVYRGRDGDLDWSIDVDGHLTICGVGSYSGGENLSMSGWRLFSDQIKTATVQVTGITSTACMFYGCSNLTSVDLSQLDTRLVVSMNGMFSGCKNLTEIDVSSLDTDIVKNMSCMFSDCSRLKSLHLNNFDTSLVQDMSGMFSGCTSLENLEIQNFDTENVINMSSMFGNCKNLKTLQVDCFDTANVTCMSCMFSECSGLETLDVTHFDTSNVTNMNGMFSGCNKLTSLDLSHFDASAVKDASLMFVNCDSIMELQAPKNLQVPCDLPVSTGNMHYMVWYDSLGNEYDMLKLGEASSVLYSRKAQWLKENNVTILLDDAYFFAGKEVTPVPEVIYRNAVKLQEKRDYKISYENNKKIGTGTIVITGTGKYTGCIKKEFSIVDNMGSLKSCNIYFVSPQNSSKNGGEDVGHSLFVSIKILKPAKNYIIELSDHRGKALKTIKYTAKDNRDYFQKTIKNLSEDMYGVRIRAGKGSKYGRWSDRVYVIKQPKAEARVERGKVQIKWKKISGVTGYEIYMSKTKDGEYTKVATVRKNTTQKVIGKFKKKKLGKGTYYYYVLAKKKSGGVTYRSKCNTTYKVRIK